MADTIWGLDAAQDLAFRNAYIASLDPRLQAIWQKRLASNVDAFELLTEALDLAKTGEVLVNLAVDGLGSDPLPWMIVMENQGYHSMWNALQEAGSVALYGVTPDKAPSGATLVSSNIADWPSFTQVTPPPPFDASLVGNDLGFQINGKEVYSAAAQAHFPEGYPNGAYTFHLMGNTLMSPSQRTGVWLKS